MATLAHRLPPEQDELLRALAKAGCYRCQSTGVAKWKYHGTGAVVCKCVKETLTGMFHDLEVLA